MPESGVESAQHEPADRSRCFLHLMGRAEEALLNKLRSRVPGIIERLKLESSNANLLGQSTIWGIDMQEENTASDIVLLKFLRAEKLDCDAAAERLFQTLKWRAENGIDSLVTAELPERFRGHDSITEDRSGRPVLISRYGQMENDQVFADTDAFVRYRLQVMEKAVSRMHFDSGSAETLCQVHDYSGVNSVFKSAPVKEGISAMSKVFSEHYPETKGTTIFVNFPALFAQIFRAFSFFIPASTRKKFVVLGDSDHEILFRHLAPEFVPVSLGGMQQDPPAGLHAPCQVVGVKPRTTEEVELCAVSNPTTIHWELRVCRDEVAYEVTFTPNGSATEKVVHGSEPYRSLVAENGVVAGSFCTESGGVLKCRFRNSDSWFSSRLCLCRAECSAYSEE